MADDSITTEDSGAGIDYYVVFDIRVAFDTFNGVAVFVVGKAEGTEGNTLIEFDV
jgi:hypothetical protein